MPNIKDFTDALTALTAPVAGDLVYVRNAAGNRKMTVQNLLKGLSTMPVQGRDGGDIGGYLMDGVNDYISVGHHTNLNFGVSDFSLEIWLNCSVLSNAYIILKLDATAGIIIQLVGASGALYPRIKVSGGSLTNIETSPILITVNSWNHIVMNFDRDGDYTGYQNGKLTTTQNISALSGDINSASAFEISSSSYFNGRILLARVYNRVLTATEIASIYNNGRPDLYKFAYSDNNASNTVLTSGTLTIGKRYRLKDFITGDDFTNVGAASNADGVEFIATGTTPATWTNSSEVIRIGCTAEFLPHNAGRIGWIDGSGNQLSAATVGSPICLNTEARPSHYRDIRKTIAANTNTTLTSIVPRGYKIVSIRAKGSDSLADIKIGSSSGGEQIVAATTTSGTNPKLLTLASTANDAYSESADVTLYARHDTSASGKTMDLIFHFEKVGN